MKLQGVITKVIVMDLEQDKILNSCITQCLAYLLYVLHETDLVFALPADTSQYRNIFY